MPGKKRHSSSGSVLQVPAHSVLGEVAVTAPAFLMWAFLCVQSLFWSFLRICSCL